MMLSINKRQKKHKPYLSDRACGHIRFTVVHHTERTHTRILFSTLAILLRLLYNDYGTTYIDSMGELIRMNPTNSNTLHAETTPLRPVGLRYTDMTKRAMQICFQAHQGQTDKGGMPYALHPIHLAEQMETEDEICTALLHDVVEDTDYTIEDLRQAGFNETILEAITLLTHEPDVPYMDYVMGTRHNPLARKVKLADLLHNSDLGRLENPTDHDRCQQKKYLAARKLLEEA